MSVLPLALFTVLCAQSNDPADQGDAEPPVRPGAEEAEPEVLGSPLAGEAPDEALEELKEPEPESQHPQSAAPNPGEQPQGERQPGGSPGPGGVSAGRFEDPADLGADLGMDPGLRTEKRPPDAPREHVRRRQIAPVEGVDLSEEEEEAEEPKARRKRRRVSRRKRRPSAAAVEDTPSAPLEPVPTPFVLLSQVGAAAGVPIVFGCMHYILTAMTMLAWPLLIYPLLAGYAITCMGNSLGQRNQGALWPMVAALVTSCGGWLALVVGLGVLMAVTGGALFTDNSTGPLFAGVALGALPLPAITGGLAATAVWALVDTDDLPLGDLIGTPRMLGEDSDTARLLRTLMGRPEVAPAPRRWAVAQRY